MKRIAALLLCLLPGLALAAPAPRPLLAADSHIGFVATQLNVPIEGRFRRFDAEIALDPDQPQAGSARITVYTGSITIDAGEADREAVKPVWLDVPGFPEARFASDSVRALGGQRFEARGQLTIKGHSQALSVPFTATPQDDGGLLLEGEFTIQRGDYAVGSGDWSGFDIVANDVVVHFHLRLGPQPPA